MKSILPTKDYKFALGSSHLTIALKSGKLQSSCKNEVTPKLGSWSRHSRLHHHNTMKASLPERIHPSPPLLYPHDLGIRAFRSNSMAGFLFLLVADPRNAREIMISLAFNRV